MSMGGPDVQSPRASIAETCPFEPVAHLKNVVLCDGPLSRRAHQELFNLPDHSYVIPPPGGEESFSLIGFVSELVRRKAPHDSQPPDGDSHYFRVQMALTWESLLKVVRWTDAVPVTADIFIELGQAGLSSGELRQFRNADPADLFPWLYYGKRFEVFRKLCHAAKRQTETRLKDYQARFLCHLVDAATGRLVASSL